LRALFGALDGAGTFQAPPGELSVVFVSEEEISRIHADFMGDPNPTDVITFPGDRELKQAGEIIVCPAIALSYASEHGTDFSEELTLYLIHGYLHLCGFEDKEDADRAKMRRAEAKALEIVAATLPSFAIGP